MKKVMLTALLLLSGNLALANAFVEKSDYKTPAQPSLSQQEVTAQQDLQAALGSQL